MAYLLDLEASLPANMVVSGTLIAIPAGNGGSTLYPVIIPDEGPFYTNDFKLELTTNNGATYTPLVLNKDYKFSHSFTEASIATGRPVFGGVILEDKALTGKIRYTCRVIGGLWSAADTVVIIAAINTGGYDHRTVYWDEIDQVPDNFPVLAHTLAATDITQHDAIIKALNDLTASMSGANKKQMMDYILCHLDCSGSCEPLDRKHVDDIYLKIRESQRKVALIVAGLTNTSIKGIILGQSSSLPAVTPKRSNGDDAVEGDYYLLTKKDGTNRDGLYEVNGAGVLKLKKEIMDFRLNEVMSTVAIGSENNTNTGANNSSLGVLALHSNTTGSNNTANGVNALYSNTTGSYNAANGYQALYSNTTGINNTANGVHALYSNTTGIDNTANGVNALYSNTTGTSNVANGVNALYYNTTGNYNTANGVNALYYNTTGIGNTANGYRSLYSNTTGAQNTANGMYALRANTTGAQNTANGYQVLLSNTTGAQNTANGHRSLYSNTTGEHNTANGVDALHHNTTGSYNTVNGYQTLHWSATGSNNTANGYRAGYGLKGDNNTIMGARLSITGSYDGLVSLSAGDGTGIRVFATDAAANAALPGGGHSLYLLTSDNLLRVKK